MAGALKSASSNSRSIRSDSTALTDETIEKSAIQNEYFASFRQSKYCTSIVAARLTACASGITPSCFHCSMASRSTEEYYSPKYKVTLGCRREQTCFQRRKAVRRETGTDSRKVKCPRFCPGARQGLL